MTWDHFKNRQELAIFKGTTYFIIHTTSEARRLSHLSTFLLANFILLCSDCLTKDNRDKLHGCKFFHDSCLLLCIKMWNKLHFKSTFVTRHFLSFILKII